MKVTDMESSYLNDTSDATKVRFISSNHSADAEISGKLLSDDEDKPKEKKDDLPPVPFLKLFQYSTITDRLMIALGCFIAVISGGVMPAVVVLFGALIDRFVIFQMQGEINSMKLDNITFPNSSVSFTNTTNQSAISILSESIGHLTAEHDTINSTKTFDMLIAEFRKDSTNLSLYIGGIGLSLFVLHYITVSFLSISAENQIFRIKHLFMKCILKQDIGWFDVNETGDFTSRISTDLMRIRDGIGEKISMCIYFTTTSFLCLIFAFYYGWKLTLVILSLMPILIISTAVMAKIQGKVSVSELSAYGKAGAVAEEVLSSIRTVVSFGGEQKEITRYEENLIDAKKSGIKRGLLTSIGGSMIWFCIYCSYALGFWYGVKLIVESRNNGDELYTAGNLVIVFFNVLTAAMNIGQASPYVEAFVMAKGAAAKIFHIIQRVPYIDSSSQEGAKPSKVLGKIELINVEFSYPARKNVQVLNGLSLEGNPGETVALVGPSGCGKSTVIQLIQRFYDPAEGKVLLDGKNIKDINVGWLRKQIGVVGQEPSLFATTIAENIRHGFPNALEEDIENAAKAANAHDFIMKLPKKYNTIVGERGAQLSGGQKQRIAIARALIRNPKVLLLDEATSALDTESESVVQAALDQAREGRTTFVVAHRLTTIRNANKIVVINKGAIEETGNHTELMEKKGLYYQLVTAQQAEIIDKDEEIFVQKRDIWIRQESLISMSSCGSRESNGNIHAFKASLKRKNEDEQESPDEKDANPSKMRLAKLATKEWPYVLFGSSCSLVMGLSVPFYGIIFGEILGTLANVDNNKIRKDSEWFSLLFVIIGIITGLAAFFQTFMFSIAGEKLTLRLRKMVFKTMISQDIAWFDDPKNRTGALCSRLSSDASQVQGATGSRMATVCQAIATFLSSIFLAIYYNWKVGLVALCFIPLVMLATYFESRIISGHMLQDKDTTETATKIAVEAIENIRTVASLHEEQSFCDAYVSTISLTHKSASKRSQIRGLTFGFAQCIPCFAYSISMYYGSILVSKNELLFGDLFKLCEGIIFGTMMVGQAVAFAPDYQKAKVSAVRIFKLLDLEATIDAFSPVGRVQKFMKGQVEFQRVGFNYPTRPGASILRNLSLSVEPGQTVALVGSSGCGKSTCIQLIQRFYDALKGQVAIDGVNIKQYNVAWLRSQMGVVSQEPVLFGYSIAQNIAYGDNSRFVPMNEITEAARKANIHDFISSLPSGYDTSVGDRGTQLSGGQKQRIAIARALVRNPKILLLDEATSALDTESEKVVQEALDQARIGRTSIIIAHRLSTVQNADKIMVIHKGCVVEQGTHQQLLSLKGFYHKLHSIQEGKAA